VVESLLTLFDGAGSPAWNMAVDEALLAEPKAWLRFYAWQPPALSLGYFQSVAELAGLAPELPRVRRPTGGGAILHADEITIALALPAARLGTTAAGAHELLNEAVGRAVASFGVLLRRPTNACRQAQRSRGFCFAEPTRLDLLAPDGHKVFGSAGRRRQDRALQHGSLILRRHPLAPFTGELPALLPLRAELERALAESLGQALHLTPCSSRLPDSAAATARHLVEQRYGNDRWTARR
jgi:lipoate-protein ligase A